MQTINITSTTKSRANLHCGPKHPIYDSNNFVYHQPTVAIFCNKHYKELIV